MTRSLERLGSTLIMGFFVVVLVFVLLSGCATVKKALPTWPHYLCYPVRVEGLDAPVWYCAPAAKPLVPTPAEAPKGPTL